jgi:hypothetical protein
MNTLLIAMSNLKPDTRNLQHGTPEGGRRRPVFDTDFTDYID